MAELLGDEGGVHAGHSADCRIGVTAIVWRAVSDPQVAKGGAPLVMDVGGLSDVLPVLRGREDEGRFLDLADPGFPTLGVLPGELQGMQGALIEQHEAVIAGLGPLDHLAQGHGAGALAGRRERGQLGNGACAAVSSRST